MYYDWGLMGGNAFATLAQTGLVARRRVVLGEGCAACHFVRTT